MNFRRMKHCNHIAKHVPGSGGPTPKCKRLNAPFKESKIPSYGSSKGYKGEKEMADVYNVTHFFSFTSRPPGHPRMRLLCESSLTGRCTPRSNLEPIYAVQKNSVRCICGSTSMSGQLVQPLSIMSHLV